MLTFLSTIGQWLLKIFLGGLFNKVMAQVEDEAQAKQDAAVVVAQSTQESANTQVAVVLAQDDVKTHYSDKPQNPNDPFDNSDWNK